MQCGCKIPHCIKGILYKNPKKGEETLGYQC